MNHFVITDVNADMGSSCCIISALEEHQVAGLHIGRGYTGADMPETIRTEPSNIPSHSAVIDHPGHKTGAVKRSAWRRTAPNIRIAEIFFGFFHHSGKLRVRKSFGRNFVILILGVDIGVYIGRIGKQVGTITEGTHIGRIHGKLLLTHNVHRYMREIEVFQLHRTDIIIIRYFISVCMRVSVFVRPCVGFRAVACFYYERFC